MRLIRSGVAVTAVVVLGVSGSGKTTVGLLLAARLGWRYVDADDHHPETSLEKMRAGVPLSDADRWPWLRTLGRMLDGPAETVLACSALRRGYRDVLADGRPGVRFVYLAVAREVVAGRVSGRTGHFFPPALLDSQYAALEEPSPDEAALTVDGTLPPAEIVTRITTWLAAHR
ncbi:MAG: gluconokinase [Micromonosporaceae bacterium]